jgi:uncharacterized protein (DUF488 family)
VPLLTVGHGTATPEELAARLTGAGVQQLVDVRRFPGSRRHPHLSREAVAAWLPPAGVAYRWEERLGGRRAVAPDSPDVALRNASFRGYAAWMRTDAFRAALLGVLGQQQLTAVMCSESVWWRCHRRMVADAAALLHDVEVLHLMPDGRLTPHPPTDGVRRDGGDLVYDAGTLPVS